MEFIRELSKTKKILLAIVLTIFILSIGFFIYHKFFFVDKANIYYRVYTKEKGWSSWRKNGQTAGNGKYEIKNIQLRTSRKEGFKYVGYGLFFDNNWHSEEELIELNNSKNASGLRVLFLDKKYEFSNDICYRTHNKKDGWLQWSCNNSKNGNKNEEIDALEIKAIPKGVYKWEYLKDYDDNISSNIGF